MREQSPRSPRRHSAALAGALTLGAFAGAEEGCGYFPTIDPQGYYARVDREFRTANDALVFFHQPGMRRLLTDLAAVSEPGSVEHQTIQALQAVDADLAPVFRRIEARRFPSDREHVPEDTFVLEAYSACESRGSDFMDRLNQSVIGLRSLDRETRRSILGSLYTVLRSSPEESAVAAKHFAVELLRADHDEIYRVRSRETPRENVRLPLDFSFDERSMVRELVEAETAQRETDRARYRRSTDPVPVYSPPPIDSFRGARVIYGAIFESRASNGNLIHDIIRRHREMSPDAVQRLLLRIGIRAAAGLVREIELERAYPSR